MRLRKSYWLLPLLVLSFVFLLTAGIPNVSTGTWQTWNNLGDVRSGAAAVLLQDGRVLIIGGTNANGPVSSADLFGTDGVFSAATAMQTPRSGHTATVLSDGRVLVTGGTTSSGGAVNTAEIYDPNANSWSAQVATVDARSGHTASLLSDGRVLLAGGRDSAGNALSSLEIFDPTSGKFSSAGALSVPRMNHAASTLGDGRVLIIGGTADGTTALASIDIYDPSAGTVSTGPVLSTPRMSATATTTLGGKVAVIGGNNGAVSGSQDLASAEIFDPATGLLSPSASSLATARSGHQSFLLPKNNAILVVGGSSAGTDLSSAELYYPWLDSFQSTAAMSVARPGLAGSAVGLDGRFLTAGGTGLASTELYGFATVKTDAADYPPGSTVTITGSGWQPGETVTLTFLESPLIDTHPPLTAVADSNGNIVNNQFSPDVHDVDVRFYLTAVGSQSGLQAQNTFTDAPKNYDATISPMTSTAGTTAVSYTVTIKNDPSTGTQQLGDATVAVPSAFSSVTLGTPTASGWTASYTAPTITLLANAGSNKLNAGQSVSIQVTATNPCPTTPPESYTWTTTAGSNATGVQTDFSLLGSQPAVSITGSCIAPTTLSVTAAGGTYGGTTTLSATLTKTSDSSAVSGKNISFTLNGTSVGSATTDGSGVATLSSVPLTGINAGSYSTGVGASFAGDSSFVESSATNSLTVTKASSTTVVTFEAGPYTYRGTAFTATAVATGVGGLNSPVTVVYSGDCLNVTVANGCTATATFAGDTNHNGSSDNKSITITKADSTTTVTFESGPYVYRGTAFTATAVATGVGGLNSPVTVVYSGDCLNVTVANGCTATANFAGDTNHNGSSDNKSITITKASSTTVVTFEAGPYTYRGTAFTATAVATGVGGLNSPVTVVYSGDCLSVTVANGCTATVNFAGDTNHNGSSDNKSITITKASSTTVVTFEAGPYTYRGTAFTATAVATGVGGLNSPVTVVYSGDCLNVTVANGCTATANFAGDTNHDGSSDSKSITITKASSTTVVTFEAGPYTYRGTAFTATAVATGVGGLNSPVTVVYSGDCLNVTVANGCTATANFAGDTNHDGSSDNKSITITKASSTTVVTFEAGPYTYRGTAFTATAVATGVGGLNSPVTVVYSGDCLNVTVANGCTATATFAGDTNHGGSSDSKSITITKASSTTVVTFEAGPYTYRGTAFTATAVATGVGGLNSPVTVVYSGDCLNVTVANGCTATATFAGDTNHNGSSDNKSITITKADSTTTVTFESGPYVYRGTAFTATAVATGVGGLNSPVTVAYSGDCLNVTVANGCTATATFAGDANHNGSSGNKSITITKANATINVTPYSVAYNGAAHTATGTATGVKGEALSGLSLSGTTHTNPGDYLTDAWTFADVTGNYNNAGGTVHDSIGYGACSVGAGGVILPPINSDGTSVYNRKGGSTIPVKFNVCGANGTPITDPMLVFAPTGGALTMTGALRGTITVVNEDGNTDIPDAAFTWDGQQWHFNMATMNLNSGYTYMFTINLAYAPASIHFVVGVK